MRRFLMYPAFLVAVVSPTAVADLIVFDFTATGSGAAGGGVVEGQFGYDTTSTDQNTSQDNVGVYDAFFSLTVSGGIQDGGAFDFSDATVNVRDGIGGPGTNDQLQAVSPSDRSFLNLGDTTGTIFTDDSLPTSLAFSDFTGGNIYLSWEDLGLVQPPRVANQLIYIIRSLSLAPADPPVTTVPEPGTLALLGAGLIGMGFARRRKKA